MSLSRCNWNFGRWVIAVVMMSLGSVTIPIHAQTLNGTPAGAGGALTIKPATPIVLDLPTTIRMTIEASAALAMANRSLDKDKAAISEADSLGLPRVESSVTETALNRPIKVQFGSQSIMTMPDSTQDVQLKVTWPFDLTGQLSNGRALERLQLLADQFLRDQIVNGLVLKANTAYLNELRASHQFSVAKTALQDAQTQQEIAGRQFDVGTGLKIDLLRANTQVAQAQNALLQAADMLALAQNNLNDITGRPLNAAISVSDVAGVTTGVAVAPQPTVAGKTPDVSVPPMSTPAFFSPPLVELNAIDINKSIADALTTRPELLADQVLIEAAKRQIKLAHRSIEPTLKLTTSGDYYPTTSFEQPYSQMQSVLATLTFPLYDAGQARDEVRAAKDDAENAKTTYESNKSDVELQVRETYLNLQTAGQQIAAANTALQQAVAARELAQVRFTNGVGLYLEVTDAETALTAAETGQVNAVYGYLIARAQFDNAIGKPMMNPTL